MSPNMLKQLVKRSPPPPQKNVPIWLSFINLNVVVKFLPFVMQAANKQATQKKKAPPPPKEVEEESSEEESSEDEEEVIFTCSLFWPLTSMDIKRK